jgi:enoyl-CoA hydratase/long-chain 3-hydroxyacyl-CoA dehydrogenase
MAQVIREYEALTPEHCVFATNTSAIPIGRLAEASKRPDKFIGMHYFSPVDKMPLLEIIRHAGTSDETVSRAYAMGLKQGKTPIIVKDVPGFYVNRSLGPFMDEGMALLMDGAKIADLDKALTAFGFPVGPMTLVDEVGLDVANNVAKFLAADLGNRVGTADPTMLDKVVAMGWLGRKSGKGMHIFPPGKVRAVCWCVCVLVCGCVCCGAGGQVHEGRAAVLAGVSRLYICIWIAAWCGDF